MFRNLAPCAGEVSDVWAEWQRHPCKLVAAPFDITHGARLVVDVRHVVIGAETRGGKVPLVARHAGLEQTTPRTFDGTVGL